MRRERLGNRGVYSAVRVMSWQTSFGNLTRSYLREVWALRDPRLDPYPGMGGDGLAAVSAASAAYVLLSVSVGPMAMAGVEAFSLRRAVLAYNAAQVKSFQCSSQPGEQRCQMWSIFLPHQGAAEPVAGGAVPRHLRPRGL